MWSYVVALVIGLAIGGSSIWRVQEWRRDALDKERIEAAQETQRLRARVADSASGGFEGDREKIRTEFLVVTSEVEKIVEKPVYHNVCFDADGLRALSAAVRSRSATSESAPAVPGPDSAR